MAEPWSRAPTKSAAWSGPKSPGVGGPPWQRAQSAVRVIEETLGPGGEPEQPLAGQSLAVICQSRDVDTALTAAFPEHRSGELTPDLVGSASEQRIFIHQGGVSRVFEENLHDVGEAAVLGRRASDQRAAILVAIRRRVERGEREHLFFAAMKRVLDRELPGYAE